MSRNKSFEPAALQERITNAFIAHGYDGTTLAALESACGLGKQSLYNAFGDKKAMYLSAVDCAVERAQAANVAMAMARDGRSAVQTFFDGLVLQCADVDPALHACIVSAGLLEGIDDDVIRSRLAEKWHLTHAVLRAAVERGQKDGSIISRSPASELSDHLMTAMSGLRVTARVDRSRPRLQRLVMHLLSVLDMR